MRRSPWAAELALATSPCTERLLENVLRSTPASRSLLSGRKTQELSLAPAGLGWSPQKAEPVRAYFGEGSPEQEEGRGERGVRRMSPRAQVRASDLTESVIPLCLTGFCGCRSKWSRQMQMGERGFGGRPAPCGVGGTCGPMDASGVWDHGAATAAACHSRSKQRPPGVSQGPGQETELERSG